MLEWLNMLLRDDDTKLIYILSMILFANLVDFLIGWINAKFNHKVQFSSSKAIYGIARKMILFIVLVMFIPFSLLMPDILGLGALYVLYIGYLASEINSILSHLRLSDDDKQSDMFIDFIKRAFAKGGSSK